MHVLRQHDLAVNAEGMMELHPGYDFSKHLDMARKPIVAMALQQIDGEKVRATGMPGAAIVGHLVVLLPLTYGAMARGHPVPSGYCALRGLSPIVTIASNSARN